MVRCFMTGVQVNLEQAYVLNRREAGELLDALKYRVASLRRVVEQFSPLDDQDELPNVPPARHARFAPKKHRLVCKAVADALAPGFPEIKLFMAWTVYRAQARKTALQGLPTPPLLVEHPASVGKAIVAGMPACHHDLGAHNIENRNLTRQSAEPELSAHADQRQL